MTWSEGRPVAMDLYYDPVVDEHVPSPLGLIAPVWYLAPQRPDVARSAWELAVSVAGLDGNSTVGLEDPGFASLLALQTGEFDDGRIRRRLWEALDDLHEPTRDQGSGEFTFGFGLEEPHPRGQLNARAMAGWVCRPGAWSRIFELPSDGRFTAPTVSGVDFPDVALSEARWDGTALHLAAVHRNPAAGGFTEVTVSNLPPGGNWHLQGADTSPVPVEEAAGSAPLRLVPDGRQHQVRRN
ncbi:MAG: hypothetical protein CL459_00110 [Acidimicrobiaceae bacterium]|nr:hypothetical protein [Acidimicrobiaceae bacterium]